MKIEKIKKLSGGKYKISLEDGNSITTYEDVILDEKILYKKELSDDEILNIENRNIYYKAYNDSVKYILKKLRSELEIKKYLIKKNIEEKNINDIINKLKNNKLINDDLYYKTYISDRIRLSNDGPLKIKNELILNNIDLNKIDNEIENYNEMIYNKLSKLIEKKIKTVKGSEYFIKQKIINYFINLGYDKNMIVSILENVKVDTSEALIKDYKKIYSKLSKKYNDNELNYKIKNNLFQKGYKIDEINKIL